MRSSTNPLNNMYSPFKTDPTMYRYFITLQVTPGAIHLIKIKLNHILIHVCGTKVIVILNSKYTTIDYSLNLLNPTSFWHRKKLGSFVMIVQKVLLIFISYSVVAVILKKLKRLAFYWERENLYRILNNEHQKDACSLGEKLWQT